MNTLVLAKKTGILPLKKKKIKKKSLLGKEKKNISHALEWEVKTMKFYVQAGSLSFVDTLYY